MRLAYTLRNTFRWRSDLFTVDASGTRAENLIGSQDADGFALKRIKSLMNLKVLCTRVISECTTPGVFSADPQHIDNRQSLQHLQSALSSDRYLIETCVDDELRTKGESILQFLRSWRDPESNPQSESEDSPDAQILRGGKKKRQQEELLMKQQLDMQQQMQIMLFGEVLKTMTPEHKQQMILQGGVLPVNPVNQAALPQATAGTSVPAEPAVAPPLILPAPAQPANASPPEGVPPPLVTNSLSPEVEKQLRAAYRDYYRTFATAEKSDSNRAEKLEFIKSLVQQYRIPREVYQRIEKEVRGEMGIKPKK